MFTFGYTSRKAAFIKAVVVAAFGIAGVATRTIFGFILGAILIAIGVRDLIYLAQTRPEKEEKPGAGEQAPMGETRSDKLRITDLSDVKEVEYKKEEGNYTKE